MEEKASKEGHYPRDSEKTRARILQSAIELFSNSSYDMVRSRDISQKARVDVALINRYFGSKKDLFVAVLDAISQDKPELTSDDAESRICEDFSKRLSGKNFQNTATAVRLIAFSALSPEVSSLLRERISGEIDRLSELLGVVDKTPATTLIAYVLGMHTLLQMLTEEERVSLSPEALLDPIRVVFQKKHCAETPA